MAADPATARVAARPIAFAHAVTPADATLEPTAAVPAAVTVAATLDPADAATDNPKALMAAALAAEATGDYATAVRQYEHVESLGSDQWPADLKDRLKLARAAARGD